MVTLNLSAGAIFALGVFAGVVLAGVTIVVIALASNKKQKKGE